MQTGCDTFLTALEAWAPLSWAEEWDNCGLQVGRRDKLLNKVMVALTPGEAAIQAAVSAGVDMLLTHHPMIFKPTKSIPIGVISTTLLWSDGSFNFSVVTYYSPANSSYVFLQ